MYAVTRTNINRKKPLSINDDGEKDVWQYDIIFAQYSETGAYEPGDSGGVDLDEPGIGFGNFEEIAGPWLFDVWSMYTGLFQ